MFQIPWVGAAAFSGACQLHRQISWSTETIFYSNYIYMHKSLVFGVRESKFVYIRLKLFLIFIYIYIASRKEGIQTNRVEQGGEKKIAFLYLHSGCCSLFSLSTYCVGVYWEGDAYVFWCDLYYPRRILAIEESSIPSMVPLQACAIFCSVLSEKRKVGLTTLC